MQQHEQPQPMMMGQEHALKSKLDRVANVNQYQQRYIANLTRENVELRERIQSYEKL